MKPIVWGIAFLWGIGQNLPFDGLYVHGVGAGDLPSSSRSQRC